MESRYGARRLRPSRDALLAAPFGALLLALLLPWPRPSVSLREVCDLERAGRLGARCDLVAAAERSGLDWLRRDIRIYENGLLLRLGEAPSEVRRENPGSYFTTGRSLTFSSLDASDPATNQHEYRARPGAFDPLGVARGPRRTAAFAILVALFAAACWLRRAHLLSMVGAGAASACLAGLVVQADAALFDAAVHVDAGYALPAAEAVARGSVPYRALLFNYTPLGVYQLALWSRVWPGAAAPPYWFYMTYVIANEALCALLAFVFLRRAGVSTNLSLLAALSLLSMTLWFDGSRVLFEPLYLWPTLLVACLMQAPAGRAQRAFAGLVAALAFLVKQYGGFAIWGALLAALAEGRARARQIAWISLGVLGGLSAGVLALSAQGVELRSLLEQAIGPDYPRRVETVWLEVFLRRCPLVLPALAVPFLPGAWRKHAVRVAACFLLASCLPFYFRQHQYYFLNVCPWLFLLFALGVAHLVETRPRLQSAVVVLASVLLASIPLRAAWPVASSPGAPREDQLRRGRLMNLAWPAGRPTMMLLYPSFNHVGHYLSADEARIGYRFPNEMTADQLRHGFSAAAGAWIDPRGMYARGADRALKAAGSSLEEQLRTNGYQRRIVVEDRFELWVRQSESFPRREEHPRE